MLNLRTCKRGQGDSNCQNTNATRLPPFSTHSLSAAKGFVNLRIPYLTFLILKENHSVVHVSGNVFVHAIDNGEVESMIAKLVLASVYEDAAIIISVWFANHTMVPKASKHRSKLWHPAHSNLRA